MSYTVTQLIARFRSDMDDVVLTYLWTNAEIKDYLEQAQNDFTQKVDVLYGQEELDFDATELWVETPTYVTRIRDAYIESSNNFVTLRDYENWKRNMPSSWRSDTGSVPTTLITDMKTGYARAYPIPTTSGTIIASVYRNAKRSVVDGDELEVTEASQQLAILIGARSIAYLKHDSEAYNPKQASELKDKFEGLIEDFKQRVVRRRRHTSNVAYGGI